MHARKSTSSFDIGTARGELMRGELTRFNCTHSASYRNQPSLDAYPVNVPITMLTHSTPAVPNCCCSKGSVPHWFNPQFVISDIRAFWHSVLNARAPKCQKLTRRPNIFGNRSRLLLSMWPKVMFTGSNIVTLTVLQIFHIKNCDLGSDPSRSSKVKSDCAIESHWLLSKKSSGRPTSYLWLFLNDILNQRIVTWISNLSRSSKVKPMSPTL